MTDEEERAAIIAAMERLLAGTPLRSSGNLDIISLAEEAGLKRNKLTHKHTDLKDRFYAERRAREGMTDREAKLHDEIAQLKARIDELREERDNYRTANEVFARALHALTIENDNLRRNTSRSRTAHLTAIAPVGTTRLIDSCQRLLVAGISSRHDLVSRAQRHHPQHGKIPGKSTSTVAYVAACTGRIPLNANASPKSATT